MNTWLILDTNYLCHRAFYAFGDLAYKDVKTAVVYGVLQDVVSLQDLFCANRVIFCFDYGRGHREAAVPSYKANRLKNREKTEEEGKLQEEFYAQVNALRADYLAAIGFSNVFFSEGFESDDIIASLCDTLGRSDDIIIVSSDKDLYQLLEEGRVRLYSPHNKRVTTEHAFREEWGIPPHRWARLKAMAGCSSDNIAGIAGVGELTAKRYLMGELPQHTKGYQKILQGEEVWRNNLKLTRLPYPGTPEFVVVPDTVTREKWAAVADRLGMSTIRDRPPLSGRHMRTGFLPSDRTQQSSGRD